MQSANYFDNYYFAESVAIITKAIETYKPRAVFVAYSGGKDSAIILDIAAKIFAHVYVMAIDTGLSHDNWRGLIEKHIAHYSNASLEVVSGGGFDWYRENVLDYGFGYTPNQHVIYYRMLKERAIKEHIQNNKLKYHDNIFYLTGVRRAESFKRLKTPDVMKVGVRISVNAIAHYSDVYAARYHALHLAHYENPFYSQIGNSGDCACNWTCKIKLDTLKKHSPLLGAKLEALSNESVESGGWQYGTKPPLLLPSAKAETMPEDSLCISCYQKALI